MMTGSRTNVGIAVALLVFAAGLTVALDAFSQLRRSRVLWETRRQELSELQALGASLEQAEAFRDACRAQAPASPEPETAALFRDAFPDATPEIRRTRLDRDGGWQRYDIELALSNTSVARVLQFIETAERAAPPARLERCVFRSRPGGGHADVVLNLVRLQPVP